MSPTPTPPPSAGGISLAKWISSEAVVTFAVVVIGIGVAIFTAEQRLEASVDEISRRLANLEGKVEAIYEMGMDIAVLKRDVEFLREDVQRLAPEEN